MLSLVAMSEGYSSLRYIGLVAPSMWDLPRPGIEPVFSTLAGRFFFFLCTIDKSFIRLQSVVSWKLR